MKRVIMLLIVLLMSPVCWGSSTSSTESNTFFGDTINEFYKDHSNIKSPTKIQVYQFKIQSGDIPIVLSKSLIYSSDKYVNDILSFNNMFNLPPYFSGILRSKLIKVNISDITLFHIDSNYSKVKISEINKLSATTFVMIPVVYADILQGFMVMAYDKDISINDDYMMEHVPLIHNIGNYLNNNRIDNK